MNRMVDYFNETELKHMPLICRLPIAAGKSIISSLIPYFLQSTQCLVIVPNGKCLKRTIEYSGINESEISSLWKCGYLKEYTKYMKNNTTSDKTSNMLPTYIVIKTQEESSQFRYSIPYDLTISYIKTWNAEEFERIPGEEVYDLVVLDDAHRLPTELFPNIQRKFPSVKKIYFTTTESDQMDQWCNNHTVCDYHDWGSHLSGLESHQV